jgi:hypothetical protein
MSPTGTATHCLLIKLFILQDLQFIGALTPDRAGMIGNFQVDVPLPNIGHASGTLDNINVILRRKYESQPH